MQNFSIHENYFFEGTMESDIFEKITLTFSFCKMFFWLSFNFARNF